MVRERRLRDETVLNQHSTGLAVLSVTGVSFPRVKYFTIGIVFEEVNVSDDVEHGAFVHPLTEGDDTSRTVDLR